MTRANEDDLASVAPLGERVLRGDACLAEGVEALVVAEPRFAVARDVAGPVPLRNRPDGFETLLSSIVSQQVSTAAARTIWRRLDEAGVTTPSALLGASDDTLRSLGLSRQKARYARALAEADLDYVALRAMPSDDVVRTLVEIPGIGRWTADIYLAFALRRADAFPAGDLALQEGARMLLSLESRPNERALRALAVTWSPWRAVAARLLWAYYGAVPRRGQ